MPDELNKITVVVSLAFQTWFFSFLVVPIHLIIWPPWLSTQSSTAAVSPAAVFRFQLFVGHSVDQRHTLALMVQRTPDPVQIPVLSQQFHGVNLPGRMRSHILRQPERGGSTLHILPYRLPGMVLVGVQAAGKHPPPSGVVSQIRQQRLR